MSRDDRPGLPPRGGDNDSSSESLTRYSRTSSSPLASFDSTDRDLRGGGTSAPSARSRKLTRRSSLNPDPVTPKRFPKKPPSQPRGRSAVSFGLEARIVGR